MSFPDTIQALAISNTGGFEVLEKQTVPFPKQGSDHILVKVRFIFSLQALVEAHLLAHR